jgi:hypothetical protein
VEEEENESERALFPRKEERSQKKFKKKSRPVGGLCSLFYRTRGAD